MRVLFTSITEVGHINPMLPLARAGVDRGWDVVWATGADACDRIESAGVKAVEAGLSTAERRQRRGAYLAGRQIPPEEMADHTFPLFATIAAPAMLPDLMSLTERWTPDLMVHEAAEFAGAIAAAARGVPSVTHGYGPLTPPHRMARAGEEAEGLWESMGLEPRPYGGSYDWLYLDIYPDSLQPTDTKHVRHRQPLRPMALEDPAGEDPDMLTPPQAETEPVVYLTFGTTANHEPALLAAAEAIAPLDVQMLITVGPQGEPAAMGKQPSNVRVERYVAQSRVFRRCDLVVSHGGSGTFLGAVSAAIPQLCLPQAADQFLNALACTRSGVGLALHPSQASRSEIAEAVQRLLNETTFRDRVETVAAELHAMPSPDEVVPVLETLTTRHGEPDS